MVDIQNGADHKNIERDDGYPVIGSGGVFAYASEFMYDGDSVLLGRKGTIDKPLFVSGRFWTVDTMYWTKVAPDASARFAYYTALTIPFDYYSTNTALPSMTKGVLHAHRVARPSFSEQGAIASFLDHETAKIDALVEEQQRLVELLKEKRQAVISQAVTKGLDPTVPMKDSGVEWLGKVPAKWPVARLGYFASVENGTTPSRDAPEYWVDGEIPWLASGEVNKRHVDSAEEFITHAALSQCSLRLLPVGTAIVGLIGQGRTRGLSALLGIPATINQNLAAICPGPKVEGSYLLYLFHGMYDWLREAGRGGNQAAMNCEMLRSLRIPMPPVIEQVEIIAFIEGVLARIDALSRNAESAMTLLQERRAALISAAVTGKIDVRGLAA